MYINSAAVHARQEEKEAALQEAQGVVLLEGVSCDEDPAWTLELLQRAAPTVERLEVRNPGEPHLRAAHAAMPRLRRLCVTCHDGHDHGAAQDAAPPELNGALPPGHSGLQWLRVWGLPRTALQSLLRAHSGTLEELQLHVGARGERGWPYNCSDLHSLLGPCGLRALRTLVLRRWGCIPTDIGGCEMQRAAVRAALPPGVQVLCSECDRLMVVTRGRHLV
ncbi:Receptor-type tyrosine-protein phosphatase T [Frankliniella fusca]|uniref:Receptor-type tyrosine-protein phosphatase T n=1 Tax=Frankliniella fusca TaxID=407009 RepID=A0AAE1GX09_9NEOP|nr:Receptor-type tyrosine-protein phosphatase T [Frankliniella fusca]